MGLYERAAQVLKINRICPHFVVDCLRNALYGIFINKETRTWRTSDISAEFLDDGKVETVPAES
jgi:hypothetical protein